MAATLTNLRADVERVVVRQASSSLGRDADAEDYGRAKAAISAACGWDAPPDRADQEQYDLAVRVWLNLTGF